MPILQRLPALQAVDLLAVPVAQAIAALPADRATVIEAAAIDPVRGAKVFLPGAVLAALPQVEVVEGLANPVEA